MKKCRTCKEVKDLDKFHKHKSCSQGVRPDCKDCLRESYRVKSEKYRKNNPDKRRCTVYKNKYGITLAEYNSMLKIQSNKCKICNSCDPGPKGVFAVDHCHKTGNVRGLLCYLCNMGLGSFRDNINFLNHAIKYLEDQSV